MFMIRSISQRGKSRVKEHAERTGQNINWQASAPHDLRGFYWLRNAAGFPASHRARLPVRVPNKWRGRMKRLDEIAIEWECVKVIMQYAQAVNDWDIQKVVSQIGRASCRERVGQYV